MASNAAEAARFERAISGAARQIPFAMSRALNREAFQIRNDVRAGIEQRFEIRRRWVVTGVQVPKGGTATKTKLVAEVEVERQRARFLSKFEKGGRVAARAGGLFWAPAEDERPPRRLSPVNLGFVARKRIEGGFTAPSISKGRHRTFLLDPRRNRGVNRYAQIIQRRGRRNQRGGGHLVWLWRGFETIEVPPILRFEATAVDTFERTFRTFFREAYEQALRTAR